MIVEHKKFINSGGYGGDFELRVVEGQLEISYSKQGTEGKLFDIRNRIIPEGTVIEDAELSYGIFTGSICRGVTFKDLSLQGCLMNYADFEGSTFYQGYSSKLDFRFSNLRNCSFTDISLFDADFTHTNYLDAHFICIKKEYIKSVPFPPETHAQIIAGAKGFINSDVEVQKAKTDIINLLHDHIEEDEVFESIILVTDHGTSGGGVMEKVNGITQRSDKAKKIGDIFKSSDKTKQLYKSVPRGTRVKFTFEKSLLRVLPMDILDLIEGMKEFLGYGKITLSKTIDPAKRHFESIIEYNKQGDRLKWEAHTTEFFPEEKSSEKVPFRLYDDIISLYYCLDERVEQIHLEYKDNALTVKTFPPFPEYGLEEYEESYNLETIDPSDKTALVSLIESGHKGKIAHALSLAENHDEMKDFISSRYLPIASGRLNKEDAVFSDLSGGLLNKQDFRFLLSEQPGFTKIAKSFLSFSYCNDYQSKLMVDVIGAIVCKHIDLEELKRKARDLKDETKLIALFKRYCTAVRKGMKAECGIHPEGWYEHLITRLLKQKLEELRFDKTSFREANNALYFQGFEFYLGMMSPDHLTVDLFQSETIEFSEMYWMLKTLPHVRATDTEFALPESSLPFTR